MLNWDFFKSSIILQLGKPYLFGAKWPMSDLGPKGPVDCSGFVRWAYSLVDLDIPDGSGNQYQASHSISVPALGDLGFFKNQTAVHHVGILLDDENVIEARGQMLDWQGHDIGEHVLLRPRAKWEAWKEFTGWRRLNLVEPENELA